MSYSEKLHRKWSVDGPDLDEPEYVDGMTYGPIEHPGRRAMRLAGETYPVRVDAAQPSVVVTPNPHRILPSSVEGTYRVPRRADPFITREAKKIFENSVIKDGRRLILAPPSASVWNPRPSDAILSARWQLSNLSYGDAMSASDGIPVSLVVADVIDLGIPDNVGSPMASHFPYDGETPVGIPFEATSSSAAAEASAMPLEHQMLGRIDIVRDEIGAYMESASFLQTYFLRTTRLFNNYVARDDSRLGAGGAKMREALRLARSEMKLPTETVLDLGAAPGSFTELIAKEMPTAEIVTVDHPEAPSTSESSNISMRVLVDLESEHAPSIVFDALCGAEPDCTSITGAMVTGERREPDLMGLVTGDCSITQTPDNVKTSARWEAANMRLFIGQLATALDAVDHQGWILLKAFGLRTAAMQAIVVSLASIGNLHLIKPVLSKVANEEFYIVVTDVRRSRATQLSRTVKRAMVSPPGRPITRWVVGDEFWNRPRQTNILREVATFAHALARRQLCALLSLKAAYVVALRKKITDPALVTSLYLQAQSEFGGRTYEEIEATLFRVSGRSWVGNDDLMTHGGAQAHVSNSSSARTWGAVDSSLAESNGCVPRINDGKGEWVPGFKGREESPPPEKGKS